MSNRTIAVRAHAAVRLVINELTSRLRDNDFAICSEVSIRSVCICPLLPGHSPHQDLRDPVHDERYQKQHEPDLDQSAEVYFIRCVREIAREDRSDRVRGFE